MMTDRKLRLALSTILLLGGAAVLILVLTTGRPGTAPPATPPSPSLEPALTPPTEQAQRLWEEGVTGPASFRRLALSSSEAIRHRTLRASGESRFSDAPQGVGTVHPRAAIADLATEGVTLKVAIDSDDPEAALPNLLRLDFAGKGEFTNAPIVRFDKPGGPRASHLNTHIGPATVEAMIDGRPVPVLVEGRYLHTSSFRHLTLQVGTAAQQLCEIEGDLYEVTLLDGNANARLGDVGRGELVDGRMVNLDPGDTLRFRKIDATEEERARSALYGTPVRFGETWYKISLTESGDAINIEPASAPSGRVVLPSEGSTALLVGTKRSVFIGYREDGTPVPPDRYIIWHYWVPAQMDKPSEDGAEAKSEERLAWLFAGRSTADRGQAQIIEVRSGEPVVLPMGTPLTVKAIFFTDERDRDVIYIGMDLRDIGGAQVDYIRLGDGVPPPPTLEIRSADGEIVYSAELEYG